MGFFSAVTGIDSMEESYLKTIHHCMRKINKKADDMGINLDQYYNTSNSDSFQEKSILFFLANAAIIDNNDKENMIYLKTKNLNSLDKILSRFLMDQGIKGISLKSYLLDIEINRDYLKFFSQGLFGRDFISAEKNDIFNPDLVLAKFIQLLVEERVYSEEMNDKNPTYNLDSI